MRRLLVASFLAAGLAGAFAHAGTQPSGRKTLGFGPAHPRAIYRSSVIPSVSSFGAPEDPNYVALRFLEHLNSNAHPDSSFVIRDDSYTDSNTGVTHIYARQYMYGLEVTDADINLNIKDGAVLSYGDSFYRGTEGFSLQSQSNVHADFCKDLADELQSRRDALQQQFSAQADQQVIMGAGHASGESLGNLPQLYDWNCRHVDTPFKMMSENSVFGMNDGPPTDALLQFMIAATPDQKLAQDMIDRPEEFVQDMEIVWEPHLVDSSTFSTTIKNVPGTVNPVKTKMAFIQVPNGDSTSLEAVWKFEVEMQDNWYEAAITRAAPHRIVSVVDWAADSPMPVPESHIAPVPPTPNPEGRSSYNVFPFGINDPSDGERSPQPENVDPLASPMGWHTLPYANDPAHSTSRGTKWHKTNDTWGNNVFAHENWAGRNDWETNYRPKGKEGVFDFEYDPQETNRTEALDEAKKYIDATVTQLFYTSNMVHDLYYRYGFDEVSGNFQQHNFGRGGKENDAVIANAQDGSGYNNANFMTPPDGQNGRCRMYLWNTAIPYRDGDLEAGIVIHELSHGMSTRLTGGPANSGCLGWGESGGMGEGWGDFLATTIRSNGTYQDYPMGAWAANRSTGIRNYIYSLDETINPSTYKTLDKPGYWGVHAIGEVWAEILWVTSQVLIKKHGFVDNLYPPLPNTPEAKLFYRGHADGATGPLVPKHGNSLMVQLVLNGMKMQPCRPSFFDARDAIIDADRALTGGENFCELWEGFAARGLGPEARVEGRTPWGGGIRTNDFSVPRRCGGDEPEPEEPVPEEPEDGDDDEDDELIIILSYP